MFALKNNFLTYLIYILILFWSFTNKAEAQYLLPYVENFSKADYKGDNQVWNLVQGRDKAIYVANGRYFLRYNGVNWEKHMLPNKTIIRALYSDGDRIYCGSYNEFGYWKRIDGKMQYTSISRKTNVFNKNKTNDQIWKIFKFKGKIYFQSFNNLYIYNNNTVKTLNIPFLISYCFVENNTLYLGAVNQGIYTLEHNNTFKKIDDWSSINNNIIHGFKIYNNTPYIFTKKNGVYVVKNNKPTEWEHPINSFLKTHLINTATFIEDKLLIGTAFQGIYVVDMKSQEWYTVNRNNALKNNTVLSMLVDNEKNIWLGLDNGISRVETHTPLQFFYDNTGQLGSVYSIAKIPNGYLLGSNHGVFSYTDKKLTLIPNSEGQVWDIKQIGDQYIIGHNDATYKYTNGQLKQISTINGGWEFYKSPFSNTYYQANYSGIAIYHSSPFSLPEKIENFTNPIKNVEQVVEHEIWAADFYKSLYRIEFTEQNQISSIKNVTEANNFDNDYYVKLFKFKGELYFLINNKWYTYNRLKNTLEENLLFNTQLGEVTDIIPIDNESFIIVKNNILQLIQHKNNTFNWITIPPKYYSGRLIIQDTKALNHNGKLIINLDDGFFIVNSKALTTQKNKPKITIEGYYQNQLLSQKTKIDYNKTVRLDIISENYGFEKPILYYKHNSEKNYNLVKNNTIHLNNLWTGNQNITIFYKKGEHYIKLKSYEFTVKNPWYFSLTMILVYISIISLIFFLYYKWNKVRYLQKLKLQEEKLKHQNKLEKLKLDTENQIKLQEYEKHILEMQVQTKASEVAAKSLSIAKQSEMIERIKNILDQENNADKIKVKIKKAIKTNLISKNEWINFEKNLLQSNEAFVMKLTNTYPQLTPKDIKLCIFLKMSLSSKEIAPLMNISYRGVELHRYRLRKKLNLKTETNLNKFLLSI